MREPLQLWGGIECTINRVRDQYYNQFEFNGHWRRDDDLKNVARLGLKTLRYPVLWEDVAPRADRSYDWSRSDTGLDRLRKMGVRPIAGLLHHGSGPPDTNLLDPLFPKKFAAFARAVAQRYPWLDAYTPVNEPLTTARFSGLYGHWYPHGQDAFSFAQMFLNELRAIVLAMGAIREVNPRALLVQTEDLGRIYATPALRYQADFENERRWATWDFLAGRVRPGHAMWNYFTWLGVSETDLRFFSENICCPDILGLNYYVTSERYLDENVDAYPLELRGHNGRHIYADDAAVRARPLGIAGPRIILAEAHQRYGLPLALTEIHLGCTVDEQIRWFIEAWEAASIMRERGADVRAVTAWALTGSYNWDCLVTRAGNHYEPGAFSVNEGRLELTGLGRFLQRVALGQPAQDLVPQGRGWWRKRSRLRDAAPRRVAA
jgi:dTDP-4-dehydrorhamnose reductase